ncbi:MAG: hypothetical protein AAGI07_14695, partial [Bacteroidota bacterium]
KRGDMAKHLKDLGISIEGLILDSPVSNVTKFIHHKNNNVAYPFILATEYLFNREVDGYLKYMRLGSLLKKTDYPSIILQNIGDEVTPTDQLLTELYEVSSVQLELFDGVEHGGMILHPSYKIKYLNNVKTFLQD